MGKAFRGHCYYSFYCTGNTCNSTISRCTQKNIDASKALEKAESALTQVLSDANEINKLKYVIENQGAQVEVVSKMAFKAENLLSEIAELQKKSGLINEFMMIAIAAQNDDREAFDKLGIWAVDPCFPFFELAKLAYIRIRLSYNEFTAREYLEFPWKEVWKEVNEPNKIPFSNLCEVYHASSPNFHTSLLKIIWERKDMPRKKRMQFLVDILTKDESLAATYWAGE